MRSNWPWPSKPNFQPLESMPESISKPLLSETLSMPLLQNQVELDQEVEIGNVQLYLILSSF